MDLFTLGMMKNLGGGGSNIIIIDNFNADNTTMTVNNKIFPLNYDPAEDWYPVTNSQLFTILASMFPNNIPIVYTREVDSYGRMTYSPWQADISISDRTISFNNYIFISKEANS